MQITRVTFKNKTKGNHYDEFNRLREANGFYIGPNDTPQNQLLRQQYRTRMSYNDNQDISVKYQDHHQAVVRNLTPPQSSALQQVFPTSYTSLYDDYATRSFSAGNYTY